MSSCHTPRLDIQTSPIRPSEFNDLAKTALLYLAGVAQIAHDETLDRLLGLDPSRADMFIVRQTLRDKCHPSTYPDIAALLVQHGIKVDHEAQGDVFWFTVKGCDYKIRLVARPKKSPPLPRDGAFHQTAADLDGISSGLHTGLYLMAERKGKDLVAFTLALAENEQSTWVYKGPGILDEVLIYDAAAAVVAPLPREDESLFRDQMARRPEKEAAAAAETVADERTTDDVQHGGENASGT